MALPKSNKKPKKPKMSLGQSHSFDKKHFGDEPVVPEGHEPTQMELLKIYSWYNYMLYRSEATQFLSDYYKKRDVKTYKAIKNVSEKMFDLSICWTCRLVDRGVNLPQFVVDKIDKHVQHIISKYSEKKTDDVVVVLVDKTKEKENYIIGDIEEMLDRGEPFSVYQYLTANSIPKQYANRIVAYYEPIVAELKESYENPDADLKEGYRHLSKAGKRKLLEQFETIISDADRYAENKKAERAPIQRKKKVVPVDKKVANVQFMPRFDEFQLVSQKPALLPGAKELWIYDARYKDVIHYIALEGGFDVKGTTLTNFDPVASVKKSAGRRSKEYADRIMKDSKIQLRKLMGDIKAPPREPNGRLNHNMLFLKVIS
jgi:hypothetical protein